jgi:hypothetical protein
MCEALEMHMHVVSMKIEERASPAGDGSSAMRVPDMHGLEGLLRPRVRGPWGNSWDGNGEYEVIGVSAAERFTEAAFYCMVTAREVARQLLRRHARHGPRPQAPGIPAPVPDTHAKVATAAA